MTKRSALAAALLLAGCTSVRSTPATFAGTEWRIAAVNGHAPADRLAIEFGRDEFRAWLGCNQARGGYRVQDYRIVPNVVGITERGCSSALPLAVPVMTMETWAYDVLKNPMDIEWHSGRRVTLKNSAGTLLLELNRR